MTRLSHLLWRTYHTRHDVGLATYRSRRWQCKPALRGVICLLGVIGLVSGYAAPPDKAAVPTAPASVQAPVTLGQLAALQSRKLEADLSLRGAAAPIAPDPVGRGSPASGQNLVGPRTPAELMATQVVTVIATYGTATTSRAELEINGVTRVVSAATRLGAVTVNAIHSGQVQLTVVHRGKPYTHLLRPGERIEVSPG